MSEDQKRGIKAVSIYEKLGIDLRMCMSRLIQENDVPFSMKVDDIFENKGMKAMKEANRIAAENGISDMSLDEINTEIAETRRCAQS